MSLFFVYRGKRCSCVPTCPLVTLDSEFWALGAEQRRRSQSAIIARDRWHGIRQWREHAHGTHSECCGILCLPGAFATAHMDTHMGKHHQDPQMTLDILGAMNYMSNVNTVFPSKARERRARREQVPRIYVSSWNILHVYLSLKMTGTDKLSYLLQHKNSHRQCEDACSLGNQCWSKMCCRCLCFWKRHRFVSTPTMGETSVKLSKRNISWGTLEKRMKQVDHGLSTIISAIQRTLQDISGWLVFSKQPEGWWQKVGGVET